MSSKPSGKRISGGSSNQSSVESQYKNSDKDIGLPRVVARIWGLVAGISYVSNGGYLLVQTEPGNEKCQGAGAYMIFVGLAIIVMECACCLCPGRNNCCDNFETKFPFWARGLIYFASVITPLALCFGVKTLISSIIVIMLGLLYVFLTCLVRSNKYERMQGEAQQRYREQKKNLSVTYNALSSTTNTMNSLKAAAMHNKNAKNVGKKPRAKKYKSRSSTTST